jgi:hypothetical protein
MKSYPQDSSSFQFIDFVEVGVLAGSVSFEGIWYPIPRTSAIRYATATPGLFWGTVWQINPLTQTHDFAAPGLSRSNVVTFISP